MLSRCTVGYGLPKCPSTWSTDQYGTTARVKIAQMPGNAILRRALRSHGSKLLSRVQGCSCGPAQVL